MNFLKFITHLPIEDNPYVQIFKRPEIYLKKVLLSTFLLGMITFIFNAIYIFTDLNKMIVIPHEIHQLCGFVIGLLLVFRTNTAYDRWWEGRNRLQEINSNTSFLMLMCKNCVKDMARRESVSRNIKGMLESLRVYLKGERGKGLTPAFHKKQMYYMSEIIKTLQLEFMDKRMAESEYNQMRQLLHDMMKQISSCERIKNTPIPLAYSMHIKLSIFVFLSTMPFGIFSNMGLWATPIVMILYFFIGGVDKISNEIENPFWGEPNDLPVDNIIDGIQKNIE